VVDANTRITMTAGGRHFENQKIAISQQRFDRPP